MSCSKWAYVPEKCDGDFCAGDCDFCTKARKTYEYGMRLRPFSIGCQPMQGLIERDDDSTGKYWDILIYDRPLTEDEIETYELDDLNERSKNGNCKY